MGQTRLDLALLLALLAFNAVAAHAAQQMSSALSLCKPLPRALDERLSPLSRQQELYYGELIKRAGSQAMSESVLYEFCTTARLLCSASLQQSKWGRALRTEGALASAFKTAARGRYQTDAASPLFVGWRGNSRMGNMATGPEGAKQYFRENDLMIGTQLVLPSFIYQSASHDDSNTGLKPSFLPASIALDLPPFDLQHLADLLRLFHIPFDTEMAKKMEETLKACTEAPDPVAQNVELEKKKKKKKDDDDDDSTASACATSIEAMLKFVCSMLNAPEKKIQALTNSEIVGSEGGTVTILRTMELAAGHDMVDCHELVFPFKVMGCHRIKQSKAMVVRVVEERGRDMDLLVACHKNTTSFNPNNVAFSQLHSSPGQTEICHFLPNTDIMWLPL